MINDDLPTKLFDGLATVADFAKAIHRDERTVRRMFGNGLPHVKVGRMTLIPIAGANAFFKGERPVPARRGRT